MGIRIQPPRTRLPERRPLIVDLIVGRGRGPRYMNEETWRYRQATKLVCCQTDNWIVARPLCLLAPLHFNKVPKDRI